VCLWLMYTRFRPGCRSVGRPPGWGSGSRWFESSHPDQWFPLPEERAIVKHFLNPHA
jgi:hypothetical protein